MQYEEFVYNEPVGYGPVNDPVDPGLSPYDEEPKEPRSSRSGMWLTAVVLCTVILILIASSVAAVILMRNFGPDSSHTSTEENPQRGSEGGSVVVVPPVQPELRWKGSINRDEAVHHEPAQHLPTPPPYVPVAVPKEVADQMPLVCVMGEKTSSANAFPDDGLCDYIFFDSLYKNGRNMVSRKATYSNSLNTFLSEHPPYQTTSLGVGFSYHYLPTADEELKERNPSPLASFWQQDVYHVGILDTPSLMPENQTKAAISTLKEIDSLLETQRQLGKGLISVLAIPDPELDWSLEFAIYFSDVGFTPSMVISLGHYRFGDNTVKNCVIMPPTRHPFDLPPDDIARDYNYDLHVTSAGNLPQLIAVQPLSLIDVIHVEITGIRELYRKRASSKGLVSVTMKGRWTVPMSTDHVDFFSRCLSDPSSKSDFGSYTEVCPDARSASGVKNKVQLTFSSKHCAMLTYNPSTKRAFVYDNEDALALKLCSAKDQDPELKFGIAAYDIDYDDYENQCGFLNKYGRHSRLKQLKMVIDYFRSQSGPPFNEEACRVFGAGERRG